VFGQIVAPAPTAAILEVLPITLTAALGWDFLSGKDRFSYLFFGGPSLHHLFT
jgi:hypothetical protein